MEIYRNPDRKEWAGLCARPSDFNPVVRDRVEKIIERVRTEGDAALFGLAREIDGLDMESLAVSEAEVAEAAALVAEDVKEAIRNAACNITAFHEAQYPSQVEVETALGVRCIQRPVPIRSVGLYIPGGTAPLFSTVLMLAIPAAIAGCSEGVLCTPCARNGKVAPAVLYAASYCGISKIYKVGGAQAVAAMAYGTESVPKVDKIFGPGNRYVTCAKQMVSGKYVSIDMPAGPSEVMVMADSTANAAFVAADLLSQAEHGADSQVMLVSDSDKLASEVEAEVLRQAELLSRADFVAKSLEKSRFVVVGSRDEMVAFANEYASEHLIISMENPWEIADKITAAGSVFLGNYACESAGDYASGTNHTLPTHGYALAYNGVNLDSYNRKVTFQHLSEEGIRSIGKAVVCMAENEMLEAHANAMRVRVNDVK